MADQPSPRRRFQFRLRTLMIGVMLLAIPLGYVGWQARIVRERHEATAKYHRWSALPIHNYQGNPFETWEPRPNAPWPLRWLCEEGIAAMEVPSSASAEEFAYLKRLFPEAKVFLRGERP
jgi:hypothetical protein